MKSFVSLLTVIFLSQIMFAQLSDLEIVQSLISKNHINIRAELNSLGLKYTQKKQNTGSDTVTRYIFFINGTENNIKPWEIFTKPFNEDTSRITTILIKYYYKNPGDLLEFDRFIVPDNQIINESFITFEKSEGKKQAHIKVSISTIANYRDDIAKKTGYYMVDSKTKESLYFNLSKKYSGSEDKGLFFLNAIVKGTFSCAGTEDNYLVIKFMDNDSLILDNDLADYKCDFSVASNFLLSQDDLQRIAKTQMSIIRLKQGEHEYVIFPDDTILLVKMMELFDAE